MACPDRDVLLVLYRSTDGAHWNQNSNWDTDAHLGAWHGVNVNDQGRVVKLELSQNNLRGIYLSPDVVDLPQEFFDRQ